MNRHTHTDEKFEADFLKATTKQYRPQSSISYVQSVNIAHIKKQLSSLMVHKFQL